VPARATIAVPLMAVVVGALFVAAALLKPAFMWDLGRIRLGREWFGETGMTALMVGFGVMFMALGGFLFTRR
jgi:hypothetical protein